jgi:hypothetical protein
MPTSLDLRAGDVVEVRSEAEILATLDANGELESLPFMLEMLQYCGRKLTVYKIANKACDTINQSGMLKMENAVHLNGVRCNGGGHGGCQAACLIYWKTAWLRKVEGAEADIPVSPAAPAAPAEESKLLPLLTISARKPPAEDGTEVFRCQATELLRAAPEAMPFKRTSQFVQDVRSGNATVGATSRTIFVALYNRAQGLSKKVLPQRLWIKGGRQWGNLRGTADKTPTVKLGLQPGDMVRIRSKEEVAATLNADLLNRGMGFDAEMARFCGRTAKVARRVDQIINEHTGQMIKMKNPCIVLENVVCEGVFNLSCPRAITPYWREVWLEKIGPSTGQPNGRTTATTKVGE